MHVYTYLYMEHWGLGLGWYISLNCYYEHCFMLYGRLLERAGLARMVTSTPFHPVRACMALLGSNSLFSLDISPKTAYWGEFEPIAVGLRGEIRRNRVDRNPGVGSRGYSRDRPLGQR